MTTPILAVKRLVKHYEQRRSLADRLTGKPRATVHAVNDVTFAIARGETVGLIGESGCGKSTLGRAILRLHEPTSGSVHFDGIDVTALDDKALIKLRSRMQIVFQDPYASLNPRRTVTEIVGLPLSIQGLATPAERTERVQGVLTRVGLRADQFGRYPHQFSGGQRQRIGIARALISRPDLVICDEPVSALDVSIKAQILELLGDLKSEFSLTYLFISHDIAVVGYLADRIAVMYLGEIVEIGPAREVLESARHPYTQALMSAVPRVEARGKRQRIVLKGDLPSPLSPPTGCKFHTRCPYVMPECSSNAPRPVALNSDGTHQVACYLFKSTNASDTPDIDAVANHHSGRDRP